jgi:FMN phosphatase YigB (HAD superfamily)
MITTYLFDQDDTLIDTEIYAQAYKPLLELIKIKFSLSDSELEAKATEICKKKNQYGRWDTGTLSKSLGLLDEYYKLLESKIHVIPVLHDTAEYVLKELKTRGKRIGIVSGSMHTTIQFYLEKYNLTEYIDFIYSRDEAGYQKDNSEYWKRLIAKEKLKPSGCLMIGDNIKEDIEIPKKFGFNTFQIKNSKDLLKVLEFHKE